MFVLSSEAAVGDRGEQLAEARVVVLDDRGHLGAVGPGRGRLRAVERDEVPDEHVRRDRPGRAHVRGGVAQREVELRLAGVGRARERVAFVTSAGYPSTLPSSNGALDWSTVIAPKLVPTIVMRTSSAPTSNGGSSPT